MDQDTSIKQYELSYHLLPEFEEAEAVAKAAEIEGIITGNGGRILTSQSPKRKHLSYPLRLKHYSYFGVIDFNAPTDALEKINAQLKLFTDVMRYLLINGYPANKRVLRSLTSTKRRPRKTEEMGATPSRETKTKIAEPEMEKQLEDVIEKL